MGVRPAKTQISLGIRPVWSESSLCAHWVAKDPSFLYADSEDSDQTGRMPRLICLRWVHSHIVDFVTSRLICFFFLFKDCGPWYLAYEHNANGNSVSGSKLDLINKLKNGASIRVANTNGDFYVTSIQNAIQVGSEVCAQALMHISINGFDKFQVLTLV